MSIGIAGFEHVSTTTPGKLDVIDWQKAIVKNRYGNVTWDGVGISIPGYHEQLSRHSLELSDYGITDEKKIMVDWTYNIYQNLLNEKEKIGFKGHVWHGNLIKLTQMLWEKGIQVDVIDYDDTAYLTQDHLSFLEEACRKDVKVFTLILATRGHSGGLSYFLDNWRKDLDIPAYRHKRGNMTYSWGDIQAGAVISTANKMGYHCDVQKYWGRSSMISCIITKK